MAEIRRRLRLKSELGSREPVSGDAQRGRTRPESYIDRFSVFSYKSVYPYSAMETPMPDVPLQDATFERLQRHAQPLVDTTDSVINRALDALEALSADASLPANEDTGERQIDPKNLPNLTHTKLLAAKIDGHELAKPNWNLLLDTMLIRAGKTLGDFDKLKQLCPINMVKGKKDTEGYGHLEEIDISVQGLDANGACRAAVMLAQGLGISLELGFMWRLKDAAAYPGERAHLHVPGKG